jgi:hypothetical protein
MCNRSSVIPRTDGTGTPLTCDTGVCIIDSTSIDLVDSQVDGDIDVRQVCGNCAGTCSCIVDNTKVLTSNTTIGGNLTVGEICTNALCLEPNPNGSEPAQIVVPCNGDPEADQETLTEAYQARTEQSQRISLLWFFLLLFAILLILYLFYRLVRG